MTLGQGAQAVAEYLAMNWSPTRTGRPDLPDVMRDAQGDPSTDVNDADEPGKVLILADRQDQVQVNHGVFDAIYCYAPEAAPPSTEDQGYAEERVEELVQVDIEITDRTDSETGERLSARDRMVGDRDNTTNNETGPYPGLVGEVKYLLELTRRGLDEWDVARTDAVNVFTGNSNANWSYRVTLEQVAKNTADV